MKITDEKKIKEGYLKLFRELTSKDINFCLLENTNFLDSLSGDVDLYISSIRRFETFLQEISLKLIQKFEHHYGATHYFLLYEDVVLSLDVYKCYIVEHRLIFDSDFFESNVEFRNNLPFLKKNAWLKYFFIKRILKQDFYIKLKDAEKMYLKQIVVNDAVFLRLQKDLLYLLEINDLEVLKKVRKKLLKLFPIYKKSLLFEPIRVVKRIVKPTGLIIAFLGPDGAGKSTTINKLKANKHLPFRRINYFHLKPRVLAKKGNGKPVVNPHAKPSHRGIKSYLKLIYFVADYVVGYFIKILPLKICSSLIIFDRYYDDILIDPKRYRYAGSLKIAKSLRNFIPGPDIYIILTADPEIIYQRKKELDFEELKRQIGEYEKLIDNKQYFKVDASLPPEKIVKEIIDIVSNKLAKNFRNEGN